MDKKLVRHAAGETWVDETLGEWDDSMCLPAFVPLFVSRSMYLSARELLEIQQRVRFLGDVGG